MFKKLLVYILPVFLLAAVSLCFTLSESISAKVNQSKSSIQNNKTTVVYYFYGSPRCTTCKKIEKYTQEAIAENFSKEIKAGKVLFRGVDYDKPENKHFLNDYKLFTKSVIASEIKNGKEIKYKNLDKIWTLTNNEKSFKDYITKEVKTSMGK